MGINLQKGQRISLSKEAPGLTKLICGLGWDVAKRSGGGLFGAFSSAPDYDLDASVICLGQNAKLNDSGNVVYFGNLSHRSGAITHLGDNLTGAGDGDDEQIIVDLSRMPSQIVNWFLQLTFTIALHVSKTSDKLKMRLCVWLISLIIKNLPNTTYQVLNTKA